MKGRILFATTGLIVVATVGGLLLDRNAERRAAPAAPPSAVGIPAAAQQAAVALPSLPAEEPKTATPPSFDVVRVDPEGIAVIAGRAAPNAEITVLDAGKAIGAATANARGEWVVLPDTTLSPGAHSLSVTARDRGGDPSRPPDAVASDTLALVLPSRAQQSAAPAGAPPNERSPETIVVRSGNSLWRIARESYGEGGRYALIYKANHDRIGDPDLIYPGQVLTLPVSH